MPRSDQDLQVNEQSPLISAESTEQDEDVEEGPLSDNLELEDSFIESKSNWYLILLTLSIGGLQIVWSVELSNGSPYLLSLGMSKALLAFVWLAGPLTGVLVQPYIGIKSDRCRISWGKRKPFMIAGTLGTIASSMLLAYARDILRVLCRLDTTAPYEGFYRTGTIIFATILMWTLDFAINTVQAAIRAFIVDNAPAHQQDSANAWASRIVGIGSVLGYIFGYLELPKYFQFFGNTQFKVLVVIASIVLSSTVLISVLTIKERNPQYDSPSKAEDGSSGLFSFLKQVFISIKRLPPQIRKVCEVQFFHWIGWFPFLFYITTYIGQLYVDPHLKPGLSDDEVDKLWAKATRIGTLALLVYAITSFAANILLPFFIVPSYQPTVAGNGDSLIRSISQISPLNSRPGSFSRADGAYNGLQRHSSFSLPREYSNLGAFTSSGGKNFIQRILSRLQIPGLTLRRTWLFAQLLFSTCMFSTFFISTPIGATIMTALVGLSWSLTLWAPFALISGEIARRDELRRQRQRLKLQSGEIDDELGYEEDEDKAGIILGLHNVAVSAPQILATLVSSAIFKALQKDRHTPGDTSVGLTLRFGGLATLGAAFITWRMAEPDQEQEQRVVVERRTMSQSP